MKCSLAILFFIIVFGSTGLLANEEFQPKRQSNEEVTAKPKVLTKEKSASLERLLMQVSAVEQQELVVPKTDVKVKTQVEEEVKLDIKTEVEVRDKVEVKTEVKVEDKTETKTKTQIQEEIAVVQKNEVKESTALKQETLSRNDLDKNVLIEEVIDPRDFRYAKTSGMEFIYQGDEDWRKDPRILGIGADPIRVAVYPDPKSNEHVYVGVRGRVYSENLNRVGFSRSTIDEYYKIKLRDLISSVKRVKYERMFVHSANSLIELYPLDKRVAPLRNVVYSTVIGPVELAYAAMKDLVHSPFQKKRFEEDRLFLERMLVDFGLEANDRVEVFSTNKMPYISKIVRAALGIEDVNACHHSFRQLKKIVLRK